MFPSESIRWISGLFFCEEGQWSVGVAYDQNKLGFPGGSVIKNPPANAGDAGLIPGLERSPGVGNGNPLQSVFHLPGKFRGQRSLVGYSPWGHRVRHN